MVNAIVTSLALFGASVSALGAAHVVNSCSYDVYMCDTPADGGGYTTIDQTLSPGDEYEQTWTSLSNGAGWSIKLSQVAGSFEEDIMQYEYTYQDDATIWYDLSEVNGNPWNGNWEITSDTEGCDPRQAAYQYATDDAYGMQSCDADATITVTLCSGDSASNSTSSSSAPSYSSASASAPSYSSASASAPSYSSGSSESAISYNFDASSTAVASPTTFATLTTAAAYSSNAEGEAVAVTITEVVTEIATATAYAKRHQHHPRGAHQHA